MLNVKIKDLPEKISMYQALESCYSEQIRFMWLRLREGMSVLARCEKQIIPYLQQILKKKLMTDGKNVVIVDGRGDEGPQASRIQNIVNNLRKLVHNTESNKIFLLPYLDIITSTSHGGLSLEAKEIMTIIHENPFLVFAAFEDPEFPVPELIRQAFPAKQQLLGTNREKLSELITREEAAKFAEEEINLMQFYKYVSGLNPIRLREILKIFAKKTDYDANDPEMQKEYFKELRNYTAVGDAGLSNINLDKDIAGYHKIKDKIKENILGLLQKASQTRDEKYVRQIESIVPKGIIFCGPPGNGKTLFAKGIAEALNATIYIVNGPELKSKWVGEGEANVRRLFARARTTAPSIIVFDEIDSIAGARSGIRDGASEASHSMVNQLLTEMDGFRKEEMVFVIGTTNFVESLDSAFLRPGRFEYQLHIPYPEWSDRKEILSLYNKTLETNLGEKEMETIADWSGRLNESGTPHSGDHLNALMRNLKRYLINYELSSLDEKQLLDWLGTSFKIRRLDSEEEKIVAVHEVGHALLYNKYWRLEEIKRVTIESGASDALGMVEAKIKKNNLYTQRQLEQEIAISLGGYVAEKTIFGQCSTGALQDLKRASAIAEQMTSVFGMGNLGIPRSYADENERLNPYYYNIVSPQIDAILLEISQQTSEYIVNNKDKLERAVAALIKKRTLKNKELVDLFE